MVVGGVSVRWLSRACCSGFVVLTCVDIAGVPGTGKTATVHAVVKELKRKAEDGVSPAAAWCVRGYP